MSKYIKKYDTGGFFSSDKFNNLASGFNLLSQTGSAIFGKDHADDPGMNDEKMAANIASKFGPWGMLAAGLATASSQVTRGLGWNTGTISDHAAKATGMGKGAQLLNRGLSLINNTSFGLIGGGLLDTTDDFSITQEAQQLGGAYAGTMDRMNAAQDVTGKKFFIGGNKMKNLVNEGKRNNEILTSVGMDNTQRISSVPMASQLNSAQYFNSTSGMNKQSSAFAVGKQGMKLLSKEELAKIYLAKKESDITKFQNGGSILIPEGALHKNKHHMEDVNPELAEDLTKKGIPVVVTDSEGNVEQVAEIESSEIIFEKSLTEKIEALWKDGSDEAAIKAGKLIVDTLFNNCDDNAGLIDKVE